MEAPWVVRVLERVHDGDVAVDGEEQRVGHGGDREEVDDAPRRVVQVVVDDPAVEFPAEVRHDRRAHHAHAEIYAALEVIGMPWRKC